MKAPLHWRRVECAFDALGGKESARRHFIERRLFGHEYEVNGLRCRQGTLCSCRDESFAG